MSEKQTSASENLEFYIKGEESTQQQQHDSKKKSSPELEEEAVVTQDRPQVISSHYNAEIIDESDDEVEVIDYDDGSDDEEVLNEYLALKGQQELMMAGLTPQEAMQALQAQQIQAALQFQQMEQQRQQQEYLLKQMQAAKQEPDEKQKERLMEQAAMAQHQYMMAAAAEQHRRQLIAQNREDDDEADEPFMGLPPSCMAGGPDSAMMMGLMRPPPQPMVNLQHGMMPGEQPDPHLWMTPEEHAIYKQHVLMGRQGGPMPTGMDPTSMTQPANILTQDPLHVSAAGPGVLPQGTGFTPQQVAQLANTQNELETLATGVKLDPASTAALDMALDPAAAQAQQQVPATLPNNSAINFTGTWIEWFCALEGHEFLTMIPRSYLLDKFNWLQIRQTLKLSKQRYHECQMLVLALKAPTQADLENESFLELNQAASDMFGLVHARYLNSPEGLGVLYGKFLRGAYGHCPRALCDNQCVLPIGTNEQLRKSRVKVFCPKCEEVYIPSSMAQGGRSVALDGAYFGTSLAHAFLQAYAKSITLPPQVYFYEPKILGFHVAGARGSQYYTPARGDVAVTVELQAAIKKKMSGKWTEADERGARQLQQSGVRLKPSSTGSNPAAVGNANKNNNNNNRPPQTAVTSQAQSQQHQQQRKHKKNKS